MPPRMKKGNKKMTGYEIKYTYEGKQYSTYERAQKDQNGRPPKKDQFFKQVLDRIESLVSAGAVVTDLVEFTY